MKIEVYEDRRGYLRAAQIRDNDPPEMAPHGIPLDPPDLDQLDWEEIKRDIHNSLVRSRLFTWRDVLRRQNAISGIVARTIKAHIVRLYRIEDQHGNGRPGGEV